MKLRKLFTAILFISVAVMLNAQTLSKNEKNILKRELRKMIKNPESFKKMKNELYYEKQRVKDKSDEINAITKKRNLMVHKLNAARDSIDNCQFLLGIYKKDEEARKNTTEMNILDDSGMKYRIQIGLYSKFDISDFLDAMKVLTYENVNGKFRYTIGNFSEERDADNFKVAIRKMGIKGAFVSHYLEGKRVPKH